MRNIPAILNEWEMIHLGPGLCLHCGANTLLYDYRNLKFACVTCILKLRDDKDKHYPSTPRLTINKKVVYDKV